MEYNTVGVMLPDERLFKSLPEEERREWVKAVLKRIRESYGIERNQDLADKLGMSGKVSTIDGWSSRPKLPFYPAVKCHLDTGAALDYLIFGEKPKLRVSEADWDTMTSKLRHAIFEGNRFDLYSSVAGMETALRRFLEEIKSELNIDVGEQVDSEGEEDHKRAV